MAQPSLSRGDDTYLLPYPQEYSEPYTLRAADTVTLNGKIHRDFVQGKPFYLRKVRLVWDALSDAEIQVVKDAWRAMRDGHRTWTYVSPRGHSLTVRLDMTDPNLKVQMLPAGEGRIEYTATLNLVEA